VRRFRPGSRCRDRPGGRRQGTYANRSNCSAYLIPEWEDDQQRDRVIKRVYLGIFEDQLAGWWTIEKDWPQKRDLKTFKAWFDLRFHSIVEDLVDDILIDN